MRMQGGRYESRQSLGRDDYGCNSGNLAGNQGTGRGTGSFDRRGRAGRTGENAGTDCGGGTGEKKCIL